MTRQNAAICMAAFCLAHVAVFAQGTAPSVPTVPPAVVAPAAIFVSLGDQPAIVFDGPSAKANKIFILSRNQPLELLVKLDKWTKVRDATGSIGWLENVALGNRRHVQVSANSADIRAMPLPAALLSFESQRGVLLEVTGSATDGWLPVRHRDGQSGFVRTTQVWGG